MTALPSGRRGYKKKLTVREQELKAVVEDLAELRMRRDLLLKALHMEGRGCRRLAQVSGMNHSQISRLVNEMAGLEEEVQLLMNEGEL